jgi:hypothetical protein
MLEDVQLSLHDAISGEAILKSYTNETRQQFAAVIKKIVEDTLITTLTLSQKRMDDWMKARWITPFVMLKSPWRG